MDKSTVFKTGFGVVGAFISWVVGGLGLAFTILLGLMLLDYATGLMVGYVKKELSSRVGITGLFRKTYVIILVGCVYMIEVSVLKSNGVIGDGVVMAYSVIEFLSIVENGGKLGVPLGPLANVISAVKGKGGENRWQEKNSSQRSRRSPCSCGRKDLRSFLLSGSLRLCLRLAEKTTHGITRRVQSRQRPA
ncbi:phage holin family protein [Paenibacillus ehimensis]|uniref:phage holin family protein n=1 Tax=Paenibacillus ehimensis TaxID=79264 RepID=UPI001FE6DA48|nr:phage holin family protein [Paenibacillus ehimensis]